MALIGDMNYITIGSDTYEIADALARANQLTATFTETAVGSGVGDLALVFDTAENADDTGF